MKIVADLHLHSKYSRAVSQDMNLEEMERWARIKGIDVLATGDWTHPLWVKEIQEKLVEKNEGLYGLKNNSSDILFLLSTEISSIYKDGMKLRRVHNIVLAPSFETASKINAELVRQGCNLSSDGRPIIGLSCKDLAELVFSIDKNCLIIPAHVWTPWFALYGSMSGFDSIEEAFGEFSKYIYAIETGLSSDPLMNWRVKELDNRAILSFSDAHSGAKLGREATMISSKFQDSSSNKINYSHFVKAIRQEKDSVWKVDSTIEFYPEEGKYHYSGHRKCKIRQIEGGTCPVCGKPLTAGVMQRVERLAGRTVEEAKVLKRPPYKMLVGLSKIIAESFGVGEASKKVTDEFTKIINQLGNELFVLSEADLSEITKFSGEKIAEGIKKVRSGDIVIDPGYDGEFGTVKIWGEKNKSTLDGGQLSLL